jgi:hypothetical protein
MVRSCWETKNLQIGPQDSPPTPTQVHSAPPPACYQVVIDVLFLTNFLGNSPSIFKLLSPLIFSIQFNIRLIQNINSNIKNYKSYFNFL